MTILEIESAIINRLKEKIQGLEIGSFPEKPADYRLRHPNGALLVRYAGCTYNETLATDYIIQDRKISFEVNVLVRHLTSHKGVYAYLDAVRIALTGFKPPNCGKAYPVKEEFITEDAGIWHYGITFSMTAKAVEAAEDEQVILIKRITTIDESNEETLEVQK
jgi:Gp37 protein.